MAKNYSQEYNVPSDKVSAYPTKKFFVNMLTRDIELEDAIMDLVDNCIDGVHRERKKKAATSSKFYHGYSAEITINSNGFTIKDNCGGIPEDVAKNYAFKLGRDEGYDKDKNLETVGVYGIGMKRAIFKIGLSAEVLSHHNDSSFKVSIPTNWSQVADWYFDFEQVAKSEITRVLPKNGTQLSISNLHPYIKNKFSDKAGFLKNLTERLREHYGYIVQQGFTITLNGYKIEPITIEIISSENKDKKKSIEPYVYTSITDGVTIEVVIGFYSAPAEQDDIDKSLESSFPNRETANAGITVLCNDRVVLYANKDHLTGWGDEPVPRYHTQFVNIAGVVHFRSDDPIKLPVTTTKRGLDTSSSIYSIARNKMKEGLRHFTAFTNNWKAKSEERDNLFKKVKKVNALVPGIAKSSFKLTKIKKDKEGEYQIPDLPKPDDTMRDRLTHISYSKEKDKIQAIRDYYFDGEQMSASDIGSWSFDEMYLKIKK